MSIQEKLRIAFSWPVVRRSLILAAIVGTVLITINHGSGIAAGDVDHVCLIQCGLTMLVPYCVSTVSAVLACSEQARSKIPPSTEQE